jgi:hypothetical protein
MRFLSTETRHRNTDSNIGPGGKEQSRKPKGNNQQPIKPTGTQGPCPDLRGFCVNAPTVVVLPVPGIRCRHGTIWIASCQGVGSRAICGRTKGGLATWSEMCFGKMWVSGMPANVLAGKRSSPKLPPTMNWLAAASQLTAGESKVTIYGRPTSVPVQPLSASAVHKG